MSDDPTTALGGSDGPRPLPPALRERLATTLLAVDVDAEPMLGDVDAPRPLGTELRADLRTWLLQQPARRRTRWVQFVGAAATAVLVGGLGVLIAGRTADRVAPPVAVGPLPTSTASPDGVGAITTGGGAAVRSPHKADASAPQPSPGPHRVLRNGPTATSAGAAGGTTAYDAIAPARVHEVGPTAGPLAGGTTVTITGRRLRSVDSVRFGDQPGDDLHIRSNRSLTVVTPAVSSPRTVTIRLVGVGVVRWRPGFAYLPVPQCNRVSPAYGSADGGTWVTVRGSGFLRVGSVLFGATEAERVEVLSDTELRVLTPPHEPGRVDVRVSTPGGTSPTSTTDGFVYYGVGSQPT